MATKFITVSIDIMHDKNLTPNQKFILAEIEQLSELEKGCIASNKHFSELIGIKVQGVSNAINDLAKKGYISIDNSKTIRNYGRIITIHSDVSTIHDNVSTIHSNVESKENKTINKTINSVIEYLNIKTGKRFNSKSKDSLLIKQLLKDNYTIEDFKIVIDKKVNEWNDNDEMKKFLRPSTLFGTKFDRYLNESIPTKKTIGKPGMMIGGQVI